MKKLKKTGLNRKIKRILTELNDVSEMMICDVIASNFTLLIMNEYFDKIESYDEGVIETAKVIINELSMANRIVMDLIKFNDLNIKNFLNLSIEELEIEFDKGLVPAYHNVFAISPDMLIFYYISHNLPKDEKYNFAVKYNKKEEENYKQFSETYQKAIHLKGQENSVFEQSINEFYYGLEKEFYHVPEEEVIKDLCDRYKAEYIDGKLLISPQILKFYDNEASRIATYQNFQDITSYTLFTLDKKAMKYLENTKDNVELYRTIENLNKDNDFLKNENKFLREEISKSSEIGADKKEIVKLEQENYYLKAQLEKLEAKNKELEDTIFELKEIQEDLTLNTPKVIPTNIYSGEKLIIVGGHWHKRDKDKLRKFYLADFIEAEDIMKYTERIKNYDFVIFDTSRNSHTNYNRLKNLKNFRLISKSKKESIDDLFLKTE